MKKKRFALIVLLFFSFSSILSLAGNGPVLGSGLQIMEGTVKAVYPSIGWKGSIVVECNDKEYTIYTGIKTLFHPSRWPVTGEGVRIEYIIDRGYYKAYNIYIKEWEK